MTHCTGSQQAGRTLYGKMRWLDRQPNVPRLCQGALLSLKYVAAAHRNVRRLDADSRLASDAGKAEPRYADLLPGTN